MSENFDRTWFYFGCYQNVGHHLFNKEKQSIYILEFHQFDGQLCPEDKTLYHALITRIPHLNYSAFAWWDHTVDTRPGSNSIIFAPSLTCSKESLLAGMSKWFTWVEKRLPKPLVILEEEHTYQKG